MADINSLDIELLEKIKEKVIKVTGLNPSKNWTHKDFNFLVFFIEKNAGIRISLSTLKRIYNNENTRLPHITTLDVLSKIAYNKSWQELKKEHIENKFVSTASSTPLNKEKKKFSNTKLVLLCASFIILILCILLSFYKKEKDINILGDISFASDKSISEGVPNTIMFNYDVHNINADSLFIQQSWNKANKVAINKSGFLSSIYYYPGFHRAKLIANDSVIKQNPVHITTKDWLPVIRYKYNDKIPIYISENFNSNGKLSVSEEILKKSNVKTEKKFSLTYYNVRDFENLSGNNFVLETRLKNDSIKNSVCPTVELMIMCEMDMIRVKLTTKGCVNLSKIRIGEVTKKGVNYDLSGFGTDLYNWQNLTVKVENKHATIFLNDNKIFETNYNSDLGYVKGLSYSYNSLGSIDYVKLFNDKNNNVFEDYFED